MWAGRIKRKFGWSDDTLENIINSDTANWHRLAKAIGLSRSYCRASQREVSWRYARGLFQRPNFVSSEEGFEIRSGNWEKEAQQYAEKLAEKARQKHDYKPMATGYCEVCGTREHARVSETWGDVTVWRRVHTNPVMDDVRHMFEDSQQVRVVKQESKCGRPRCEGSGWTAPNYDGAHRVICIKCEQSVRVNRDGTLRLHFGTVW